MTLVNDDAQTQRKLKLIRENLFDIRDILDSMSDEEILMHHVEMMLRNIRDRT